MPRRYLLIVVLTGVAVLAAPAGALAATFTWKQPGDFTTTGSGSNPEHRYGAASWSYRNGTGQLPTFQTATHTWSDSSGDMIGFPSGGKLEMIAGQGHTADLRWSSPFSHAQSVSISGSVTGPSGPLCSAPTTRVSWTLTGGGSTLDSGSGSATINHASVSIPANGHVDLAVTDASTVYNQQCDTFLVTLTITATTTQPTLTSPADGATVSGGQQPTFAGTADSGLASAPAIAVIIYRGSSASGTPLQTIDTTASNGSWSKPASSPLPDGTYTAQATESVGGTVVGQSNADTFTVYNSAPIVTLNPPLHEPLDTSTPTLTGTASTNPLDSNSVSVAVYAGTAATGTPVQTDTADVGLGGRFSVTLVPGLANGEYTAVASQRGVNGTGSSAPVTFTIHIKPPPVRIGQRVHISRRGVVRITITCLGRPGQHCSGDVLILTLRSFTPVKGGPRGQLQLMFAYVSVDSGNSVTVTRRLLHYVLTALRHARKVKVRVSVTLPQPDGSTDSFAALRRLKGLR